MDMNRKRVFLILQSVLWIVLVLFLAATVTGVYRDGLAAKTENPLAPGFSRDMVVERFQKIRPLFYITLGAAAVGLVLDVKDENGIKPVNSGSVQNHAPFAGVKTLRTVLLIAAVCLLIAGAVNGSARDVFGKAVKICTECVGLG